MKPPRRVLGLICLLMMFAVSMFAPSAVSGTAWADEASPKMIARNLSLAFRAAAEKIRPSIVTISGVTSTKSTSSKPTDEGALETPLDPFGFKDLPLEGMGTGVIIDTQGLIITNDHVVGQAKELAVRLANHNVFRAKIVGRTPEADIALIQIDAKGLNPATLGDSDQLEVGDWVIAAGNPFGLENSITAGIISAKARTLFPGKGIGDLIQTDAAINPGNSGGPLVNLDGEVVGINTAIFSRTGGYMGIGFAIPINRARKLALELQHRETGTASSSGSVGTKPGEQASSDQKPYEELLGMNLISSPSGGGQSAELQIEQLDPFSIAALSGLKRGDVLLQINSEKVANLEEVAKLLSAQTLANGVRLRIRRSGREQEFAIRLSADASRSAGQN